MADDSTESTQRWMAKRRVALVVSILKGDPSVSEAARLRTDEATRVKKMANATAVIRKMPLVAERAFRHVKHPELLSSAYHGVQHVDRR